MRVGVANIRKTWFAFFFRSYDDLMEDFDRCRKNSITSETREFFPEASHPRERVQHDGNLNDIPVSDGNFRNFNNKFR